MSQPIRTARRAKSEQPAARQRTGDFNLPGFGMQVSWRIMSALLVILSGGLIYFIFTNPMFYVNHIEVGGARFVPIEEIYATSGIAGYHILWVDPESVRQQVMASQSLSSATVSVQWPARVIIVVREREPALIWEQGGERYWLDVNGNLMLMRREVAGLVRVINEGQAIPFRCPGPGCLDASSVTIDPDVALGAQQIKTLRPAIDVLYYDPVRGLSYQDPRGWRAYFGTGTDMDLKLALYETLVNTALARGIALAYVDVSNPDAPYFGRR